MNIQLIGTNIKKLREKNNMTQNELAKKLFVSFQAVSAWERGQTLPDLENAVKLANIFNVKLETLLQDRESKFYAAIDSGGTKTEAVLFERSGNIVKRVLCEGANPNAVGLEKSISVLSESIDKLFEADNAKAIFAGVAGVTTGDNAKRLKNALYEKYLIPVNVDTDGINVLAMGKDPENTASVISGTGSCVFVRKNYKLTRLGGWGNLFDPSGSAYKVGSDAVCHALAVNDGLEEPTELSRLVEEKLGGNVWEKLSGIYEKGVAYTASFAPLVTQAAAMGDKVSIGILRDNAKGLARIIKKARRDLGAPDEFVCSGGFIKNSEFKTMLEEEAGIKLYVPEVQPICGACLECLRLNGETPDEDFMKNFTESYR